MIGRVLFIAPQPFFQWRGSPIRVAFDVRALAELGYQVDLLTLPIGDELTIPGVRVVRVANPFAIANVPIGPSAHKAVFDFLLFWQGLALAIRHRYAVVHAVEEAGAFAWLIARATGARAVFEKHSDPASHRGGALKNLVLALYRRFEVLAIRRADAVIGTGVPLCEQARQAAPQQRISHIFDLPSSLAELDGERVAELRARFLVAPADSLVMYAGSFAAYQGLDLMFESMAAVLAERPRTRLVVIGGSATEIAAREDWLRRRGLSAAVSMVPPVPPADLANHLAAADLLLSPRLAGVNSPLKLLDYLRAGRAIVATDSVANRCILDPSVAVLTAPRAAPMATAIGALLDDHQGRAGMGERGRRLAATYNLEEFKRRLDDCYRQVLRPARAPAAVSPLLGDHVLQ